MKLVLQKIFNDITSPGADEFDMLVIMGGPMFVYEEEKYPWLKEEKTLIKMQLIKERKCLEFV